MPAIRALFWDVGGVLLTNAWDRTERTAALEHFHLDQEEFHDRHEMVVSSFERGKITLDEYLDRTVFYRTRPFARDAFRDYMFSLSQPFPDVLEFAQALSRLRQVLHGHDQQRIARAELLPHRQSLDCGRSSACSSVPVSSDSASRSATFIASHWRRRRSPPRSAASLTIALSIWNAQPSLECIPSRCSRRRSCAKIWRN